ncbi:Hsp20/alpha crystallin family [Synechococcus sp. PCC 7335]|uniref:Hsp20/alpha crystallin family protein n=1 Tax=Synechococcus sp. (strain ATCC 29403 / PCC 7335) TaxID=91464 RepID=UPI00017EC7EE|nr:Hsp20/alpha crystallin family protein [Synechococcus sp. PCC 7335]EDX82939.1 Hsp20/alpha crystallin family [Synechococcus sp. PCC 7335]
MAIKRWHPFGEIKRWEPFGEIDTLRQEMNRLLEQFTPNGLGESNGFAFVPSAELEETESEVLLKLEVPGMKAEDLDIEVMDEAVRVKGERKSETKTEEEGERRSEFYYGEFQRVIPMPKRVEKDQAVAEYKDGVLRLTLPKAPEETNESVKIKVA